MSDHAYDRPRQTAELQWSMSGNLTGFLALADFFRSGAPLDLSTLGAAVRRAEALASDPPVNRSRQESTTMAGVNPQVQAFADRLNAATNKLASDLAALRARNPNLSPEDAAVLDGAIAHLEAMGIDPVDPVPTV